MKIYNQIIKRVPIFLFLTIVVFDLIFTYINVEQGTYKRIFYWMNEIIGNSVVFNLFILVICIRYKLCLYNKVATIGLLALNVVNMIFMTIPMEYAIYYSIVTHTIMIPVTILSIILLFKKI